VGRDNQSWVQLEIHVMRGSLPLTPPAGPRIQSLERRTKHPWPKKKKKKKKKKSTEWFLMLFCYTHWLVPSPTVIGEQLIETDTESHSWTSGRAWGTLWKQGMKDCRSQRGPRILQENPQNQLTWAHRDSETELPTRKPTWPRPSEYML
jgi:hypothetical protein